MSPTGQEGAQTGGVREELAVGLQRGHHHEEERADEDLCAEEEERVAPGLVAWFDAFDGGHQFLSRVR